MKEHEILVNDNKKVLTYDEVVAKLGDKPMPLEITSAIADLKDELDSVKSYLVSDKSEQLDVYYKALKILDSPKGRKKQDVEKALIDISSFADFLSKGEPETGYQMIVRVGSDKKALDKAVLDAGLKELSDFYQLGINVTSLQNSIKEKEEEIEIDVEKADKAPVMTVADFRKLQAGNENFLNIMHKDYNAVNNMKNALGVIRADLEELSTSTNIVVKKEDKQRKAEAGVIAKGIAKFTEACNVLLNDKNNSYEDEEIQKALDDIHDFKNFLAKGEEKTYYEQINDIVNNHKKMSAAYKNGFSNGLKVLDDTLQCGLNPSKLSEMKPKSIYKESAKEQKKADDDGIRIDQDNISEDIRDNIIEIEERKEKLENEKLYYAINYIDEIKAEYKQNPQKFKSEIGYPKNFILSIMAARDISDARRNEPSTLRKGMMTKSEISARVEYLLDNPAFNNFVIHMQQPEILAKAESKAMSTPGHGGKVDDMFKEFLANQPAGQMNNDERIKRYMPSALQRIDALKKQAREAMAGNRSDVVRTAAAEILLLRNAVQSERGKKSSLGIGYPVDDPEFNNKIQELANDNDFKDLTEDQYIISQILEGHGGRMIDRMRTRFNRDNIENAYLSDILFEGTVNGYLKKLKSDASSLKDKINSFNEKTVYNDKNKAKEDAKKIVAEYSTLLTLKSRDNNLGEQNIPWKKVRTLTKDALRDRAFNTMFNKDETLPAKLDDVCNKQPSDYIKSFKTAMDNAKVENDLFNENARRMQAGEAQIDLNAEPEGNKNEVDIKPQGMKI